MNSTKFTFLNIIKYGVRVRNNTTAKQTPLTEATIIRKITQEDLNKFSAISGDFNPIHSEDVPEDERYVHGAFLNSLISGLIGTKVPGPGSVVISQKFQFPHKCKINQDIELNVKLIENRKIMKVLYYIKQSKQIVFEGEAKLMRMPLLK